MDIKKNQEKAHELVELFVDGNKDEFQKASQEYLNRISYNIGCAISPVNDLTLPFVVFALQEYIDALKKGNEEYVETILKSLRADSKTAVVTVPMVRSIRNDNK